MNAREKVDAERKWKRVKFSVAIFFSQNVHRLLEFEDKKSRENCSSENNQTNPDTTSWELCCKRKCPAEIF